MSERYIRMPDELYEKVRKHAKASGRTINGEINVRLQRTFTVDEIKSALREVLDENEQLASGKGP